MAIDSSHKYSPIQNGKQNGQMCHSGVDTGGKSPQRFCAESGAKISKESTKTSQVTDRNGQKVPSLPRFSSGTKHSDRRESNPFSLKNNIKFKRPLPRDKKNTVTSEKKRAENQPKKRQRPTSDSPWCEPDFKRQASDSTRGQVKCYLTNTGPLAPRESTDGQIPRSTKADDKRKIPTLRDIRVPYLPRDSVQLQTKSNGHLDTMAKGAYGFVVRGKLQQHEKLQDIVAKFFRSDRSRYKDVLKEARILHYLGDTGTVPKTHGLMDNKCRGRLPVLVQECFGDGQDIYGLLHKTTPTKVWLQTLTTAAESLKKIHNKGVLLNDIKPDNILIDTQNNIRFIDMGLATLNDGFVFQTNSSLEMYPHLAPEVKRGGRTTTMSDIFSFGVVLKTVGASANITELMALSQLLICEDPHKRCSLGSVVKALKWLQCRLS